MLSRGRGLNRRSIGDATQPLREPWPILREIAWSPVSGLLEAHDKNEMRHGRRPLQQGILRGPLEDVGEALRASRFMRED